MDIACRIPGRPFICFGNTINNRVKVSINYLFVSFFQSHKYRKPPDDEEVDSDTNVQVRSEENKTRCGLAKIIIKGNNTSINLCVIVYFTMSYKNSCIYNLYDP